jgi:hypothetical protein
VAEITKLRNFGTITLTTIFETAKAGHGDRSGYTSLENRMIKMQTTLVACPGFEPAADTSLSPIALKVEAPLQALARLGATGRRYSVSRLCRTSFDGGDRWLDLR